MKTWHPFNENINLYVPHRISKEDALRQERTAREILVRLAHQPGLVLADEVGMGKTFVALAVAVSVALSGRNQPVVVMVPPSLKDKWPRDLSVFVEACLPLELQRQVRCAVAETGVQFLKLLDNAAGCGPSLIFLTHGAMYRALTDRWVRLAIIRSALLHCRDRRLRAAVKRCAASLVEVGARIAGRDELCVDLMEAPPKSWRKVMKRHGYTPKDDDDPVPAAIIDALQDFDTGEVLAALHQHIPRNRTDTYEERLCAARSVLREAVRQLWTRSLGKLKLKLPLLILDEAHHLKNGRTQLAGLFCSPDGAADADEVARGPLGGAFERMLFLTATPFQLGHHELCSVLERFEGIAWDSPTAPPAGRDGFREEMIAVRERLDTAQEAAITLDATWGQLRADDLRVDGRPDADVEKWWTSLPSDPSPSPQAERALRSFQRSYAAMRAAEKLLRPWVIRHLRSRRLPEPWTEQERRIRLSGRAIVDDIGDESTGGLAIAGAATLPFLLAARATVCAPDTRPVFAEGLASSYEAFRHTRKGQSILDHDTESIDSLTAASASRWYIDQLEKVLPDTDIASSGAHPKIAATAERVLHAWRQREKILVFCHFIRTGQVLRRVISHRLQCAIFGEAAQRLDCSVDEAKNLLEKIGERFFGREPSVRHACDAVTRHLLAPYPSISKDEELLLDCVRRFMRTPSFLVRYFPIEAKTFNHAAVEAAFSHADASGLTLRQMLDTFFQFLEYRCSAAERMPLLEALSRMKTGDITTLSDDEQQGDDRASLIANVRLVNGDTRPETRQRLMLTFNSPFFPEVLIASNVLAEGVDLHRFCRYIIHHDLDWNPSTIEQRTGRVDRIGSKVETCGKPIRIYLPYIAETQDEKMFRVVMDRERWFSVVMGEQFKVDALHAEVLSRRIPLPTSAAAQLAFRLEVDVNSVG